MRSCKCKLYLIATTLYFCTQSYPLCTYVPNPLRLFIVRGSKTYRHNLSRDGLTLRQSDHLIERPEHLHGEEHQDDAEVPHQDDGGVQPEDHGDRFPVAIEPVRYVGCLRLLKEMHLAQILTHN